MANRLDENVPDFSIQIFERKFSNALGMLIIFIHILKRK